MSNDKKMDEQSETEPAALSAANSPSSDQHAGITSKMQTVKSVWDKAPEGEKKTEALKHYQSAEKAQKAGNDKEAFRELEEATRALN